MESVLIYHYKLFMSKQTKEKKYLWCEKCKDYPDVIFEKYNQPFWQERKWNDDCYELQRDASNELGYTQDSKFYCGECNAELIDDDAPEKEEQSCRKCGKIIPYGYSMCQSCENERS